MQELLLPWFLFLVFLSSQTRSSDAVGGDRDVQLSPLTLNNGYGQGNNRRMPFIPSIRSRRAAQKAYFEHLQNALETSQRQLYISQNTCRTLRKRFEEYKKDSFAMLARNSGTASDPNSISEDEQQRVSENEDQIEQLKRKLDAETHKYESQIEQIKLLQLEIKDMTALKEDMEQHQHQAQLDKERLNESHERLRQYEREVDLLRLKLEAADVASKRRNEQQSDAMVGDHAWQRRGEELKAELAGIRSKYRNLLLQNLGFSDWKYNSEIDRVGEQMDEAMHLIIQSSLEAIEHGWQQKFETLQSQLSNITDYAAHLQDERDSALKRMNETLQSEKSSNVSEQRELLKEELSRELTDVITEQLTEKIKENLTLQLTNEIEKKYRKKNSELHKQLIQLEERNKDFISKQTFYQEEIDERQKELLRIEVDKVKQQYESEYKSKFEELEQKSEEQIQFQKERMRKLVRALLEREVKQKQRMQSKVKTMTGEDHGRVERAAGERKVKTKTKAKKKMMYDSERNDANIFDSDTNSEHLSTSVSPTSASSRMKTRSPPGVVSKIL
mmetsp:Transcript_3922/g.8757  ORF Transcript_3922/g.8757 Transcript_3922/m.8757 type:complete len:558 (-) Transcript_3922:11-1684(-)